MSAGRKAGIGGIGGLIIAGLITLLMGGNIGDVLQNAGSMGMGGVEQQGTTDPSQFTAEEQELDEVVERYVSDEDEDDGEPEEAFPVADDPEKYAQAPANQAPDQTVDGYSADNFGMEE